MIHSQLIFMPKAIVMKSENHNEKVYVCPRNLLKMSYKDDWTCNLDSDISGSSQTQQVQRDPHADTNPQNVACWHLNMLKMIKQVQWNPYLWIRKKSTKLMSEYQDCHTQLWKKQTISEFKSLSKRFKIILIEQYFKPTCSRIASIIHSAKFIKRRWSANWVMWSCSSCAKPHQKIRCSHCLLYWNQKLCTALADNIWFTMNPEESFTN